MQNFNANWHEDLLVEYAIRLPREAPWRLTALQELVKIDLRRQWEKGNRRILESYLISYPELGTPETVSLELIQAEMQARRRVGDPTTALDLAKRFPRPMGRLQSSVKHVCADPQSEPPLGVEEKRYRILKELGRGAMGTVYLAQDTYLQRQVAMKIPHFLPGDSPDLRERFVREARAAAKLDHPNICPIYDVGEEGGRPYLTMAYIEGQPLGEVLRAWKPMPQRRAVEIVAKLARAVDEAHRHGVVHRDLKPANVMVNRRGEPVIMDFGLARRMDQDAGLTHQGAVLGTPAYMSPEQVQGDVKAMGPASDQYALGTILYELLTGQVPFKGTIGQVMAKILTETPRPPRALRPDIDPGVERICLKAMAAKPANRFASVGEFAEALEGFLSRSESSPSVDPSSIPPRSLARRSDSSLPGDMPPASSPRVSIWRRLLRFFFGK